ncbi:hypothetical protein BHF71_02200 [Vulcanibacillus modesticaldus]|uniref:Uncharacterized protein n=1 Tax=Vulcanibacillus modesticaldus TaxID=337097 RepID=A0A1D2YUQ6_9BACI|nr:hypothetical protein [Vulcanibacillus modesticaldus]OEF99417.1 hypothetical protein BHF71_02200 [Vulcanibacillus modesticaldus]
MTQQKPSKKDFVDLINSLMGQKIMTEDQLTKFLNDAKKVKETKGTEGFLEFVQKTTNAPASKDQLERLADEIKRSGNPVNAIDFLIKEKLLTDQQARKINQAIEHTKKKKRKN